MAGDVRMSVDLRGVREALGAVERLQERARDATPALRKVDKHVTTVFRRQFATEGRFGGEPWDPLAPATLEQRAQPGRGRGGILHDFGRLIGSLVKVGPESVRIIDPLYYERGTQVPYAARHQEGDRAQGLPKREIIPEPMPPEVVGTWERLLADHFAGEGGVEA